jgi:beta-aspartyl-peptidase (threonine type)
MPVSRWLSVPVACALWLAAAGAPCAPETHAGYESYRVGDPAAKRTGATEPALMLMGGGGWVDSAFRWFVAKAGHGHVVILRASGADELQKELFRLGGVASVQTLVFHDRAAASDPAVLDVVSHADGIFIAGGDQANYVRFWQGTPLNELLDRHVREGRPIGGTSAGLAILGAYAYGALDGGSIVSKEALADPLGSGVTLVEGFLHMPWLGQIVTDTHFAARGRLGRLIAFVARLRHEGHAAAVGLGVDEATVLAVDGNGIGRLFTNGDGHAWLVRPSGQPQPLVAGRPLDYRGIRLTGVGRESRIDMHDLDVQRPAFEGTADVRDGRLIVHGNVPPNHEPRDVPQD